MKLLLYFLSLQVGLCFAFLLESSTKSTILGQSSLTDRHFVTVIELLSEEKQLRHQLEQFVTQLQQEMIGLKQQMHTKTENKTCTDNDIRDLNSKITELKQNDLNLTNTLNVLNDQHVTLQSAYNAQETELMELKNRSNVFNDQLSKLQSLQSNHQLQDLQDLKIGLKNLNSKTDALSNQELARQQDLIAMYNEIKLSKNDLKNIKQQTDSFQTATNQSLADINVSTKSKFDKLDQRDSKIQETLDNEGKKVAFTACTANIVQRVIKFSNMKTSIGVNISSFMLTGIFRCEFSGLYQISVTIMSGQSDTQFSIYKNDDSKVHVHIARHDAYQEYHTSTGVGVFELDVGDTIHIDTDGSLNQVFGYYSCLTIVKVH